ncbi:MAG: hypothetical protein Q7T30_00630 [Planctomycetota bacterium]|nr:hypothetical protein [Planctomycetota bacterium]
MSPGRLSIFSLLGLCAAASAQSNTIPGLDLRLEATWALAAFQRAGAYPTGRSAIGVWTTCCNPGTVQIPFQAAMNPNHGFIHYMIARQRNGRLEQISDWSYVKHTFGSSNDPSSCGSCAGPGNFNFVEVGCADTYANNQAVDHFNLGPPDEIDPWLGTWVPQCSYFDRGNPPVGPGQICDGVRSLDYGQAINLNAGVHHQMQVRDADLDLPWWEALYYWQAGYLVPHEAEANRGDNIASTQFTPTWNGTAWTFFEGPNLVHGSILQRWEGATITSNTNGADDGRFYVGAKVTGPVNGLWHYEYAIHNRDNHRGLGALRIPVCQAARVQNLGFRDLDQDPLNDWLGSKVGGEIVWSTNGNPLHWNSIFNFWFDSDAAPAPGATLSLDQYSIGPGALTVAVLGTAPVGLYDQDLGPGCGSPSTPILFADGTPQRATIGNSSFALRSAGNPAGVACGFVLTTTPGTTALGGGCTLYSATWSGLLGPFMVVSDAGGVGTMPLAIPNDPAFEGLDLDVQAANILGGGAYLGSFNLSNGLRIRIGSLIAGCP